MSDCTKPGSWLRYLMVLDPRSENADDEELDEHVAFNLLQYIRCYAFHEKDPDPRAVRWLARALSRLSYRETRRLARKLTARRGRKTDHEGEAKKVRVGARVARLMREQGMRYEVASAEIANREHMSERQAQRRYERFQ